MLAEDSAALFEAVDENISRADLVKNLHITTEYDNLPLSQVPLLKEWILKEGTAFHERVQEFLAERDLDNKSKERASNRESAAESGGGYISPDYSPDFVARGARF